jgi:hypothetical protein
MTSQAVRDAQPKPESQDPMKIHPAARAARAEAPPQEYTASRNPMNYQYRRSQVLRQIFHQGPIGRTLQGDDCHAGNNINATTPPPDAARACQVLVGPAVAGIAAIIFGVLAFAWPGLTLVTLVLLYGAFALVDGVLSLIAAFSGSAKPIPTWWLIVVGLLGIGAGVVTFLWPGITAVLLVMFIGAWALVHGSSRSSARSNCARRSTMSGC